MHISEKKSQLRKAISQRLAALSDKDRSAESRSICRRILPTIPKESVIAAYYPLPSEADITPLIAELLARGDTVALPLYKKESMTFHVIDSLDKLEKGELNIPEPPPTAPQANPDVILVPGRAFDRSGNRLGRGNGGYDIWLTNHPGIRTVGVCLDCQLVNELPVEQHDQSLDEVATPREIIVF